MLPAEVMQQLNLEGVTGQKGRGQLGSQARASVQQRGLMTVLVSDFEESSLPLRFPLLDLSLEKVFRLEGDNVVPSSKSDESGDVDKQL